MIMCNLGDAMRIDDCCICMYLCLVGGVVYR